ncbi:16S rRNA pseudouridine(516) synthase, partial [Halorubrum sp. ARQ200]
PKHQCSKTYRVWLVDPISPETAPAFKEGVMLRGEKQPTLPATLEKVGDYEALLTIQEGKYHQVKRMFAAVGNKVDALHRESIGHLVVDEHLEPGEYRPLTDEEIALLG